MSLISDWFRFCVRSQQNQEPQTRPPAASRPPPPRKRRNRTRRTTKTALSAPIEGKRIESRRFFMSRWALRISASVSPMSTTPPICIILLCYITSRRCGANYSLCLRHRESDYALAELWKPSACFLCRRLLGECTRRLEWKLKKISANRRLLHSRCITRICHFYASWDMPKINLLLQRAGRSRCWLEPMRGVLQRKLISAECANVGRNALSCLCVEFIQCLICFFIWK